MLRESFRSEVFHRIQANALSGHMTAIEYQHHQNSYLFATGESGIVSVDSFSSDTTVSPEAVLTQTEQPEADPTSGRSYFTVLILSIFID